MADHAARFAVIRPAPDLPAGFLPPDLNGRWIEIPEWAADIPDDWPLAPGAAAVAVRTDRFERRDDGATARVFEVRP